MTLRTDAGRDTAMSVSPHREEDRLDALSRYDAMDAASEADFDHIARLAAHLFDAPIAAVSLVGRCRQVFKGSHGLFIADTPRETAFCQTDILTAPEILIVENAATDPRFADNPFVTGEPRLRFYAGAPLLTREGYALGRLCIMDTKPRPVPDGRERLLLTDLATLAMDRLERRREERRRAETENRFASFARSSPNAVICADHAGTITEWNDGATRMFGYEADEAVGRSLDIIIPQEMRAAHHAGMQRNLAGGSAGIVGATIELRATRRDGSQFPAEITVSRWDEGAGTAFGAIIKDATQRKQAEDQLYRLANFDPLTRIGNRALFQADLREAFTTHAHGALILVDIAGFRRINDCYGHDAGDAILGLVARRIEAVCRNAGDVYRLGGDEFGALLHDFDRIRVSQIAARIRDELARPFETDAGVFRPGAGIGIAELATDAPDTILGNAHLALDEARRRGCGEIVFYGGAMRAELEQRESLRTGLNHAFRNADFVLHHQPQVELATGALTGAEALLRWNHPERGLLAPGAFIAELEKAPIAAEVGKWILFEACRQAMQLRAHYGRDIRIGVNLFAAQLHRGDLPALVDRALSETGLPPKALELEITETIILDQDEIVIPQLRALRARGIGIAFDDYGTGWASLSLLKRYPLTRLKIDRSFVSDVTRDEDDAAIVKAVLALGASLGLEVVAEGIEGPDQEAFLRAHGCRTGQGYLYGRPVPLHVLTAGSAYGDQEPGPVSSANASARLRAI